LINTFGKQDREETVITRIERRRMKHPRFSREQNLACKLTDTDIAYIRKYYLPVRGKGSRILAKKFNVTKKTILYWVNDENKKKNNKLVEEYRKTHPRTDKSSSLSQKRKLLLMPKEIREYRKIKQRKFNKNHPGYNKQFYRYVKKSQTELMF
jgi:hypothetical protein